MIVKNIKIKNFRNYETLQIDFNDNINIVYGKNGSGKTNLLESIYVLAFTKSHRFLIGNNLIKTGTDTAVVKGTILNNISYNLEVILSKNNKQVKIDNDEVKKIGDYIDKTNIVVFYTEDLELIKGIPSIRRKYLNSELSQISINYFNVLTDFNKLLKMRNDYLKKISDGEKVDLNYFDILTEYFVAKSVFIYQMRDKFIQKLNKICPKIYQKITGHEGFEIVNHPSVNFTDYKAETLKKELTAMLEDNFDKELKLKTTLYGPHRDDFDFILNGQNLKNYGSQGQQRVAVITLKLSEIEILKDYKQTSPIVLLDDVFSELDIQKRESLLTYINHDCQVIITTTDLDSIEKSLLENAKLINIDNGKVVKGDEINE